MAVKLNLTISEGPEQGQVFSIESGSLVLGRNKGDIKLTDKKVSGRHCQFIVEGDSVYVEDLGSTNGTFVGSYRVDKRFELHNLDVVTVGLTKISVAIVEELKAFKKLNAIETEFNPDETAPEQSVAETHHSPIPPPPETNEEAVYRDTGIRRINHLIDDELKSFSKWDHPNIPEKSGGKSVPRIQVILNARKAPEGVTRITCTNEKTTIGRKEVDIRINDLDLSRKHSCVEIVGGHQAYIRDLASTNGTFVNGNRISYQELKAGDLVQIGQCVFEVFIKAYEK